MISIDKPTYDAGEVYELCISRVRRAVDKMRLRTCIDAIAEAEDEFDEKAGDVSLYTIPATDIVNGLLSVEDMRAVYSRMVGPTSPGRKVYDKLIMQTWKCPICGVRPVSTLDHFLPQAHFPALIVCPWNLIPACWECNKTKLTTMITEAEDQPLHPYYDDVEHEEWLLAEVHETVPASVTFRVEPPDYWADLLTDRVRYHFTLFELDKLYSANAASSLANRRNYFNRIFVRAGADEVRQFCEDSYQSLRQVHLNSWETAMYNALYQSAWFCTEGCLL